MFTIRQLILLACCAIPILGCANAGKGVAKDTEENLDAAGQAVEQTGQNLQEASEHTEEAIVGAVDAAKLTPQIKAALATNPIINDHNINVDTTDEAVYLNGTVSDESIKADVEEIAKKIIKENKAPHKVINQIDVK